MSFERWEGRDSDAERHHLTAFSTVTRQLCPIRPLFFRVYSLKGMLLAPTYFAVCRSTHFRRYPPRGQATVASLFARWYGFANKNLRFFRPCKWRDRVYCAKKLLSILEEPARLRPSEPR